VVTLPLAYLLVGVLPGAQARDRLAKPRYRAALIAPFFVYGGLVGSLMVAGLSGEDAGFRVPSLPPGRYFLTQCHVIVVYLAATRLARGAERGLGSSAGERSRRSGGACLWNLSLALLLARRGDPCLLRARGRDGRSAATVRTATFGIFWFFLLLAPTSSFIPLADVLMEHRLYLASWGIFLAIVVSAAAAFERLSTRVRSGLALVSVLAICSVLAMASYARVGLWRTKRSLWSDAVAKSPGKSRVHLGLGNAYRREGEPERALQEYRLALSLAGSDPRWQRSEIRGKLASVLLAQSRASDAIAEVEAGLGEDPDDSVLLGVLAMAHLQRHEPAQAEDAAERSVRSAKRPGASLRILGLAHEAAGHLEAATSAFKRAVALEPDEAQGGLLLARSYRALGRPRDACAVLGAIRQPGSELRAPLADALAPCPPP
jgi:tetratricopeptide (TPR) repeat protein